jgi:hypothetical protein
MENRQIVEKMENRQIDEKTGILYGEHAKAKKNVTDWMDIHVRKQGYKHSNLPSSFFGKKLQKSCFYLPVCLLGAELPNIE